MVASPCPLVALSVIHESFELADHAHSRAVFSARLPLPPDAGISGGLLVIETAHFVSVGALILVDADPPHRANAATIRRSQTFREDRKRRAHMFVCTGQQAGRLQTGRREPLVQFEATDSALLPFRRPFRSSPRTGVW